MFSRLLALRKFLGGHEVLLLWISISIVLTLTGPFGTFEHMPIRIRAIYWPGLIAVALVFAGFISNSVPSFAASWPRPALEILRVAVFTMGFAPFVVIVSVQLSPEVTLAAAPWPYMVAYVLVITTAISVVRQSVIASLHDLQRDTQEPEITMAYKDDETGLWVLARPDNTSFDGVLADYKKINTQGRAFDHGVCDARTTQHGSRAR